MRIEPIEDAGDARLGDYRAGGASAGGHRDGVFIAEGRVVVRALLAAERFRARSVLVTPAALAGLRDALQTASEIPVYLASPAVLRSTVGYRFSRGCLAAGEAGPTAPNLSPAQGRRGDSEARG